MLKIIAATHRLFFSQIVNNICYFNLIVYCKTSEGGGNLEGTLFSNYSILSKFA